MCYFSNALRYPVPTINAICHSLQDPKFDRVDFIVGTGISGTLLLVPVSLKVNIQCGVIRKSLDVDSDHEDGGSHSSHDVEYTPYDRNVNRYIIIDDLIESGKTIDMIIRAMKAVFPHSQCTGIILYQNYDGTKDEFSNGWNGIPLTCLNNDIFELRCM